MTTLDDVVEILQARGVFAELEIYPGPTDIVVTLKRRLLLVCVGFNREGWEAVETTTAHPETQTPLPDGPDADASAGDVATWICGLI